NRLPQKHSHSVFPFSFRHPHGIAQKLFTTQQTDKPKTHEHTQELTGRSIAVAGIRHRGGRSTGTGTADSAVVRGGRYPGRSRNRQRTLLYAAYARRHLSLQGYGTAVPMGQNQRMAFGTGGRTTGFGRLGHAPELQGQKRHRAGSTGP